MATDVEWNGGASVTAQIETFTLNNDFNNSESALTMTMTAEDNSTAQTVAIDPSGVDESAIATAWETALDASTDSLFTAVTWSVSSNVVTGTAKTAGVPFYAASSVTSGAGTVTDSVATANSGPNDWMTAANWSDSAVPAAGDTVWVVEGSYDILYGLTTSNALKALYIGENYKGSIGQPNNSYYLQVDCNNASPNKCVVNGRGATYWIDGTIPNLYVTGCSSNDSAVQIKGDVDNAYVMGSRVSGKVTFGASMALDNLYVVGASASRVKVNSSITSLDLFEIDSGTVEINSGTSNVTSMTVNGGIVTVEDGQFSNVELRGGTLNFFTGDATAGSTQCIDGTLTVFGGQMNIRGQTSAMTIDATTQYGGSINVRSGQDNITYTANPVVHGGQLISDTGSTVTP